MSKYIIDRRENPKGKSLSNRQRFIQKSKKILEDQIKKNLSNRSITDTGDEKVSIPIDGISEPTFSDNPNTGEYDFVLPGNHDFLPGDKIPKPKEGGGDGGGGEASDSGEGEDQFTFTLTRDEYLDILFDDLELPNLEEKNKEKVEVYEKIRAGYVTEGNPAQLDIIKSVSNSLGRRIALGRQKKLRLKRELEAQLEATENEEERLVIIEELEKIKRKLRGVSFIDPIDLRYRNYTKHPRPTTSAVMICVMDVSASMDEMAKELSKRFFMLMYLFLERKYANIDVVFIRHHSEAIECGEEEFFNSKETGGTVVSKSLALASTIIQERYSPTEWNIYIAQCSDGDNFDSDSAELGRIMESQILPITKYFTYIQVSPGPHPAASMYGYATGRTTVLWKSYDSLQTTFNNLISRKVTKRSDIIPIFRDIFKRTGADSE